MAAHLPDLLERAGATPLAAVAAAALVGPAQVVARLIEFILLRRIHPLVSARIAATLHPIGAAVLALMGPAGAAPFAILYGAGNGLLTIARGTVPLALFEPQRLRRTHWPHRRAGARRAGAGAAAVRAHARRVRIGGDLRLGRPLPRRARRPPLPARARQRGRNADVARKRLTPGFAGRGEPDAQLPFTESSAGAAGNRSRKPRGPQGRRFEPSALRQISPLRGGICRVVARRAKADEMEACNSDRHNDFREAPIRTAGAVAAL